MKLLKYMNRRFNKEETAPDIMEFGICSNWVRLLEMEFGICDNWVILLEMEFGICGNWVILLEMEFGICCNWVRLLEIDKRGVVMTRIMQVVSCGSWVIPFNWNPAVLAAVCKQRSPLEFHFEAGILATVDVHTAAQLQNCGMHCVPSDRFVRECHDTATLNRPHPGLWIIGRGRSRI
jgi:hypothetical protein